jgi:putative ABC transport system permease protein
MATGRKPGPGEVVLDEVAADRLGVGPGDHVQLLGRDFVVSGLSRGGTSITNSTAFVRMQDFAAIRGPSVSYLLVGATPGTSADVLRQRLARARPDTTVQTRDEFVDQERAIVRDMSADIMQIMTVIAFLIAVAVIALTLFAATLAKLREYAVVKAIGADTRRLTWTVVEQSIWAIGLALVASVLVSLAVAGLAATATPNVRLAIEPASLVRVAGAGMIAGTLGALAPLRRVARVDPSSALKG